MLLLFERPKHNFAEFSQSIFSLKKLAKFSLIVFARPLYLALIKLSMIQFFLERQIRLKTASVAGIPEPYFADKLPIANIHIGY